MFIEARQAGSFVRAFTARQAARLTLARGAAKFAFSFGLQYEYDVIVHLEFFLFRGIWVPPCIFIHL
jgi:hypothetical protein